MISPVVPFSVKAVSKMRAALREVEAARGALPDYLVVDSFAAFERSLGVKSTPHRKQTVERLHGIPVRENVFLPQGWYVLADANGNALKVGRYDSA